METVTKSALFMTFDADIEMPEAKPAQKRDAVIEKATEFAIAQGCKPADVAKIRGTFVNGVNPDGTPAPCPLGLITWRICLANINKLVEARNEIWEPMSGKMHVVGRNTTPYDIVLRPDTTEDPQVTLGVAIQKKGSALVDEKTGVIKEVPYFWTYAGVTLQTEVRHGFNGDSQAGLPLVLAFDVTAAPDSNGKGKVLGGNWSRRIYVTRERNPVTGQVVTTNRLADISRGPNDELMFLHALIDAGFPVHTARLNRNPVNQNSQWTPRGQSQRQPRSLVGAGMNNGSSLPDHDMFADGDE